MKTISLNLLGPFNIFQNQCDLILDQTTIGRPGIYFWTVKVGEEYLINYVGISANSIRERIVQHIKFSLSGDYTIYDPNLLQSGVLDIVYTPNSNYNLFLLNIEANRNNIIANLKLFKIFYVTLDESKYLLELIESEIIQSIRIGNSKSKLFLSNYKLSRLKDENQNINIKFSTEYSLNGLPSKLIL